MYSYGRLERAPFSCKNKGLVHIGQKFKFGVSPINNYWILIKKDCYGAFLSAFDQPLFS